jgi:hypothetical protein
MMASDIAVMHNFAMPEDCDSSGGVSPLDALVVINELNQANSDRTNDTKMLDVDADGRLSPLDALVVINYLNRENGSNSDHVSAVPMPSRIARLESAIANGTLPASLVLEDAQVLLQTMKNGGRPETGERFLEGRLCSPTEVDQIETEQIATELTPSTIDAEHPRRLEHFIERFASKLASAGIDAKVIETISGEIRAGIEAKTPLTLEQIKTRLTELGVDVSKLFPTTPPIIDPTALDHRINEFVARLTKAGVTTEVINTIATELKNSIVAGTPLTLEQIKARLTELGVDVTKIFPTPPPHEHPTPSPTSWTPSVELVTKVLTRFNVKTESIEIVRKAMVAANEAGSPLNVLQVLKLLKDNDIHLPREIARLLRP